MKVKVIKLDDRYDIREEDKENIGKVFEAFVITNEYEQDEKYKTQYALNLHKYVWFVPAFCCEVVEEPAIEEFKESLKTKQWEVMPEPSRVLLVEDGSVDTEELDELGIKYIVYRSGARPPEWL